MKIRFSHNNTSEPLLCSGSDVLLYNSHADNIIHGADGVGYVFADAIAKVHNSIGVFVAGLIDHVLNIYVPVTDEVQYAGKHTGTLWWRTQRRQTPMRLREALGRLTEFLILPLSR